MDQEFIRTRLEQLRQEKRLSFRDLHDRLKLNRYTLKKLFNGEIGNTRDKALLREVIEHLGLTEDEFFHRRRTTAQREKPSAGLATNTIALYGEIPAGNPLGIDGTAAPEEWIAPAHGVHSHNVFALRVRGQSMFPRFLPGDLVYFERLDIRMGPKDSTNPVPRLTFERLKDRMVAVLVDGEATFKQLRIHGHEDATYELELVPLNAPEFDPLRILPEHNVHFQGVAIATLRLEP